MKPLVTLTLVLAISLYENTRAEALEESEILATRGEGVLTQQLFDIRVSRIPENRRLEVLRDRARLQDVINSLLLHTQLTADAREAGLASDPEVRSRMELAAQEELAKAWLEQYVALKEPGDYEAMAKEYYQVHNDRFKTEKTVNVTHILVGTQERTDQEASDRAEQLHAQILADPALFDELVMSDSDDPSVQSNSGKFKKVSRGQMVKPFENKAFSLQDGQISDPVKTEYGYHIIRMDKINSRRAQSFKEVREALIDQMRSQHEKRVQNDYLRYLTTLDVEMTEEALELMAARHFGEERLKNKQSSNGSE